VYQGMSLSLSSEPISKPPIHFSLFLYIHTTQPCPPFKNLHVRVRQQIVADGLDKALNWESAGYDMPPLEWHQKLKEAREAKQRLSSDRSDNDDGSSKSDEEKEAEKNIPLIFDCRNDYETSVGIFEGADPLDTENFRESWDVFADKLKDTPKDTPIMTYCTGGEIIAFAITICFILFMVSFVSREGDS
jgi:UPF0176 protein